MQAKNISKIDQIKIHKFSTIIFQSFDNADSSDKNYSNKNSLCFAQKHYKTQYHQKYDMDFKNELSCCVLGTLYHFLYFSFPEIFKKK